MCLKYVIGVGHRPWVIVCFTQGCFVCGEKCFCGGLHGYLKKY